VQAGVPLKLVKKWVGHARLSATEIFAEAIGAEEQAITNRFWQTFQK
jgi:integrase/recombinase XerD